MLPLEFWQAVLRAVRSVALLLFSLGIPSWDKCRAWWVTEIGGRDKEAAIGQRGRKGTSSGHELLRLQ